MTGHGGGFARTAPSAGAAAEVVAPRPPGALASAPGFRHFLGDPTPAQRFAIDGQDPTASLVNADALRKLMGRLAEVYTAGYWNQDTRDNQAIPAGYTYLMQFMAHDLVQSSMPLSIVQDGTAGLRNERTSRLLLDVVYGNGPDGCPFPYTVDDPSDRSRTKLRLGRMRPIPANPAPAPFRDLARAATPDATGEDVNELTEALVADPRNDDHAIISQLTTVFHTLHNSIMDMLPPTDPASPSFTRDSYRRFHCAREAATLIYHSVIRRDVLKRILDDGIYAAYTAPGAKFIDEDSPGLPMEFACGAYRFGHAMIRNTYHINAGGAELEVKEALARSSARRPELLPLDTTWIVQWSRFFEMGDPPPQYSQLIGPQYSRELRSNDLFPQVDATASFIFVYRDLMSAGLSGLWSVNALADEIARRNPDLARNYAHSLLFDAAARRTAITDWLTKVRDNGGFTDDDIRLLAADPPLPFFVLFEAAVEAKGAHLGLLGSIIVAEVMFRALSKGRLAQQNGPAPLQPALRLLCRAFYDADHLADIPEIEDMPGLIGFTADAAKLRTVVPAFV